MDNVAPDKGVTFRIHKPLLYLIFMYLLEERTKENNIKFETFYNFINLINKDKIIHPISVFLSWLLPLIIFETSMKSSMHKFTSEWSFTQILEAKVMCTSIFFLIKHLQGYNIAVLHSWLQRQIEFYLLVISNLTIWNIIIGIHTLVIEKWIHLNMYWKKPCHNVNK